jgi:hypothetical protein
MDQRHRLPPLLSSFLIATIAAAFAGCSTQGTDPGDSVLVSGADHVIWKSAGGGFSPTIPPGAACHYQASYDVSLQSGTLAWSVCTVTNNNYNDPAAFVLAGGSRTLSAAESAQARAAIAAVKVSSGTSCGADLDARSLEVDSASGQIVYGDDFYACLKQYDHYVETGGLNSLGQVLEGMARP